METTPTSRPRSSPCPARIHPSAHPSPNLPPVRFLTWTPWPPAPTPLAGPPLLPLKARLSSPLNSTQLSPSLTPPRHNFTSLAILPLPSLADLPRTAPSHLNTMAACPGSSPRPATLSIPERLTPPITTSSSAPHTCRPEPSPCGNIRVGKKGEGKGSHQSGMHEVRGQEQGTGLQN